MSNTSTLRDDIVRADVSHLPATIGAADDAAEVLRARLEAYSAQAEGAFSPSTERAIASDTRHWAAWCVEHGATPLPATPAALAAYVADSAKSLKPATIRRRLTSIAHQHRAAGLTAPTTDSQVTLALRRLGREQCSRQEQAAPLGHAEVEKILATTGQAMVDHRDIALLLTARDGLLRRAELVAVAAEDIDGADDGSGTLLIKRSKTDRIGAGAVVYLDKRTMLALVEWVTRAGITSGAIFRSLDRSGRLTPHTLSPDDVSRIFKKMAGRAGIDATHISGHSARVGMAQDLAASGAELAALQLAGRWKSPTMPARYAERLAVGRGAVAQFYAKLAKVMTEG